MKQITAVVWAHVGKMETNFFNICSNFSMTVCVEHCIRCSLV